MRAWNEFVAVVADLVGGIFMLGFLSVLLTGLIALGWYYWPRWLPSRWRWPGRARDGERVRGPRGRRRLGRLRWRLRWRWRRRKRGRPAVEGDLDLPPDALPDLPAEQLALTADQLAAAGRYAEAVRERLRAIIAELIERGVLPVSPGWTVTELARGATLARPALAEPLRSAVAVFSEIWYGLRPATVEDDLALRAATASVRATLATAEPVGAQS